MKKKYVIELDDKYASPDNELIVGCSYYIRIAKLAPYIEPDMEKVREEAHEQGLSDAWEAAKKIALMDTETSENVTGYFGLFRIMENLTPMQAIEKIRQYEQEQKKIKVGDEVDGKGGRGIITKISDDGDHFNVMWENGSTGYYMIGDFKKTGRHFPEIAEVLRKMRGETDSKSKSKRQSKQIPGQMSLL